MRKTLLLGVIVSGLTINSSFAVTSTVTSKDYVDDAVDTRQLKIPVSGTNSEIPGDTVVTYTSSAGTIGERRICHSGMYYQGECVPEDLVPAEMIDMIHNELNIPKTTVTYKTCYEWSGMPHTDANCILWNLTDKVVTGCIENGYGDENVCTTNGQCCSGYCNDDGYCDE